MNTQDPENTLETDDIYLGAYFMICSCELVSTRNIGQKVLFTFKNPAGSMSELRKAYFMGATGRLNEYAQKVITMKQLCHP